MVSLSLCRKPFKLKSNKKFRTWTKKSWVFFAFRDSYFFFFYIFIIQRVKARAIPYPHQPPSRGDNTVPVAQGGTATPGATKQLLPPDRVLRESYIYIYIYIYIYTPDQLNAETTLDVNLHFLSAVCQTVVPELRSRKFFFAFRDSYVIYKHFMNFIWTFHIFMYGYVTPKYGRIFDSRYRSMAEFLTHPRMKREFF